MLSVVDFVLILNKRLGVLDALQFVFLERAEGGVKLCAVCVV